MRSFVIACLVGASYALGSPNDVVAMQDPCYPTGTGAQAISYPIGPTAEGTTLTASSSANTKGAYVELVASTPFTSTDLVVTAIQGSSTFNTYLLDIAIGAASSEVDIVPNIIIDRNNTTSHTAAGSWTLPLAIPSGSRISARIQSTNASSQTLEMALTLIQAGAVPAPASYTNLGAITATSRGTLIDPGGSADTKGSYTELSASTSADYNIVIPMLTTHGESRANNGRWAIDLAIGAAASEVVFLPDLRASAGNIIPITPRSFPSRVWIPSGSRVSARASSSITDAGDRTIDVALLAGTVTTGNACGASGGGSGGSFPFVGG